jgi:hypothetical protein
MIAQLLSPLIETRDVNLFLSHNLQHMLISCGIFFLDVLRGVLRMHNFLGGLKQFKYHEFEAPIQIWLPWQQKNFA